MTTEAKQPTSEEAPPKKRRRAKTKRPELVEGAGELAHKLDGLFLLRPADREEEYTHQEVADAINAENSTEKEKVSATYVWQLRTGRSDNPTASRIKALAKFFGVSPFYLLGGDDELDTRVQEELEELAAMRAHGVKQVAYQMAAMSEEGRAVFGNFGARIAALPEEGREVIAKVLAGLESAAKLAADAANNGTDHEHV
jgi:transcriptional regulator with XRE-family HTH domain